VTTGWLDHKVLAEKTYPEDAYEFLRTRMENVRIKPLFPRMTEVVLERTFDTQIASRLLKESGLPVILVDSKYAYHLNHQSINKSVGFRVALHLLGTKPEESIAIGDSETDIPLFDLCSYSIALGNAEDYVKAKAKYCVKNTDGSGLVEALEHIAYNFLGMRDDIQTLDK
jgi:hydroxymethylpyrimidine pyrophosphatase-like HAD family hydrolase